MKLEDLADILGEDAFNNVSTWKKRNYFDKEKDAKTRVLKGKGEKIGQRVAPENSSSESVAKRYVKNMTTQHIDSKGKRKDYDGTSIVQGLSSTFRNKNGEDLGTTEFEIIKELKRKGLLDNDFIKKSKKLTDAQKAELLGKQAK